jgi:predicted NBD/HSP70 family sugar kinase
MSPHVGGPNDSIDRPPPLNGPGSLLRLIREGGGVTRSDLARLTGLGRSTVTQRIDALLEHHLIYEAGGGVTTGGRPPTVLAFNHMAGVILAADFGATHSRLAVSDLGSAPLAERAFDLDIGAGPEHSLALVESHFATMLEELGRDPADVRGIGIGVPGPVAFTTGQPVNPPVMPRWDGFVVPAWFAETYDAPVLVDNDVNIMAFGEHWTHWRGVEHFLFVKVGTGIGAGLVADGAIHRGAQGAAGDIGHIRLGGHDDVLCRCGNTGCLEAVASGHALALRLAEAGREVSDSRGVVRLARAGDALAIHMVRDAGRALGEVLAGCINFFNPGVIVIGGDLSGAEEHLLAGVREVTIQRSLPLATRALRIVRNQLGDRAGVVGAALMVLDHVLAPDVVDRTVHGGTSAAV